MTYDSYQMNGRGYGDQATAPPPPYQQYPGAPSPPFQQSMPQNPNYLPQQPSMMPMGQQQPQQGREEVFRQIINRYEISPEFSAKLQKLNTFKIVFIFDDSGSMCSPLEDSPLNKGFMKVR